MKTVRMRMATDEEVKVLKEQQELLMLQRQSRRLDIKSVAKSRQRNNMQTQPNSPLRGNVRVKKIALPQSRSQITPSQLRAVIRGDM